MFVALVNNTHQIQARHVSDLKRKASQWANKQSNPVDMMVVRETPPETVLTNGRQVLFHRFNQKSPDGRIVRGQWV